LSVARTNTRAIRAYCKQGWSHAGPRVDQPGIVYMHRNLSPSPRPFDPIL
jgi:hypothetical protein